MNALKRKHEQDRVVVTGMGVQSSIGHDVDTFWNSLIQGSCGIQSVEGLRLAHSKSKIGGQIQSLSDAYPFLMEEGWDDRGLKLALNALHQALQNHAPITSLYPSDRIGVVMGTCSGGIYSAQRWLEQYWTSETPTNSKYAKMYYYNFVTELISGLVQAGGPVSTVSTACASSNNAIGLAADFIRSGKADMMLVGGYDALLETVYSGFTSVSALDDQPCRPYSADRSGLSLGEGAAFLILERYDVVKARNARMFAEILGYGLALDGYHPTAPHPEGAGAARAMETALKNSNLKPEDIDYINGHGTGTLLNDLSETRAIISALGESAYRVPISSTKAATGHTLGASGVIEGIATIQSIQEGMLPPTIHLNQRDPNLVLDYVPNEARVSSVQVALSNSFAFGGNNAVVAYGQPFDNRKPFIYESNSIVVTGMGMATTEGLGIQPFWHAFSNGKLKNTETQVSRKGNRYYRISDTLFEQMESKFDRKAIRRLDRNSLMALYAVNDALQHAGIKMEESLRERTGIISSHAFAVYEQFAELFRPVLNPSYRVRPSVFPNSVYNGAVGAIASHFQVYGPGSTLNGAQSSSALGIIHAMELLKKGDCDAIICIGSDVHCDESIDALADLNVITKSIPRPFDHSRDGLMSAEGSVALILETEKHAVARHANVMGRITDYSLKSNQTLPGKINLEENACYRAMKELLNTYDISPEVIWSSASGLKYGDLMEAKAIEQLFSREAIPAIASVKAVFGETWGASTLMSIAAAILSNQHGMIPGIPTYHQQDFDIHHIQPRSQAIEAKHKSVFVNSLNEGGTSASFLLEFLQD